MSRTQKKTGGESRVDAAATTLPKEHFSIYCLNIRCLLSKLAELKVQIERLKPHLIIFQETWLDACIESVSIPGYALVSRRDRSCQSNRGGIASFSRHDVRNIVSIGDSEVAERSWHLLHTDLGGIAIVNWYRPGAAPLSHIESFAAEYEQYCHQCTSIIVAGDLNIHHLFRC